MAATASIMTTAATDRVRVCTVTASLGALLRTSLVTAKRWTARGLISILDQGFMSGSNFAVGLFFARILTPADYGSFSIVFSVFLLLAALHNALVLEPLSVVGPKRYAGVAASYLRTT